MMPIFFALNTSFSSLCGGSIEYFTKEVYEDDLRTIESMIKVKLKYAYYK